MKYKPNALNEEQEDDGMDVDDDGNNNDNNNDDEKDDGNLSKLMGSKISNSDFLVLEDENGSIKITGKCFKKHKLLTGIIMAIKGKINRENGYFIGKEYLLCGLPEISSSSSLSSPTSLQNGDKYVALISGLEISKMKNDANHTTAIKLLFDYLSGYSSLSENDNDLSSKICRTLFVGNILSEELPDEDESIFYDQSFKKHQDKSINSLDVRLKELDLMISQLTTTCFVDIMPGFLDPSDGSLPQQPFHRCLFPMSSSRSTFKRVTNPYKITIDNNIFLGTSGQNFFDMMKYSQLNMIETMELSLKSRIIAPTAPDTLACFPFKINDPFIINQCPNVYFSGNNDKFRFKNIIHPQDNKTNICLIQIPSFIKTKQIVLFNLNTMKPQIMQFGFA